MISLNKKNIDRLNKIIMNLGAIKNKLKGTEEQENYYDLLEAIGKIQKVINEISDREKDK